jgi:hypothetical protein
VIRAGKAIGQFRGVSELDPDQFKLDLIDEMPISAFLSPFEPVDVEGISRNIEARFGRDLVLAGVGDRDPRGRPETRSGFRSVGLEGRGMGGPVMNGTPYIVGELGPELFVPDRSGSIVPNGEFGGSTYNITVQAGVGDPVRIGEEVVTAIKRYERVSGPVFASA